MVGDFLDEGVGAVGDRDALGGRRVDIDRVDPDAAERDDLAALEPVDHLRLVIAPPLGVERVGVAAPPRRTRPRTRAGSRKISASIGVSASIS